MEYYGREPSSDFFMHYGIKGMKWGVRKAVEKGNAKRLGKEYAKARRKLDRLNSAADLKTNERRLATNKKIAAIGASVGSLGTAAAVNQILKKKKMYNDLWDAQEKMDNTNSWSYAAKRVEALRNNDYDKWEQMGNQSRADIHNYYDKLHNLEDREGHITANHVIGGSIGAAGFGTAAVAGGRAALAKYRMTKKGHSKAVAKRDAFRNAMVETFNDKKAQQLSVAALPQIQKVANKSVQRSIREKLKNDEFFVKKAQKQAKRRARLERKIGKLS